MKKYKYILNRIKIVALIILCLNFVVKIAWANNIPSLVIPKGVGVNIHFTTGHKKDIKMIAKAGFKLIRMDFSWSTIEQKKGIYNWSQWDILTKNLIKYDIHPLYILDYSNALYEPNGWAPQTPLAISSYAQWAAAAVKHFKGNHIIWEIYNEPNGSWFWHPKVNVKQYINLALATCKAIKKVDPDTTIIAPACAGFDWPYLKAICKSGLLKYINGVSIHPYRPTIMPPETVISEYIKLQAMIKKYAPVNKKIYIIDSEWGYTTGPEGNGGGYNPSIQGDYLVRIQLINLLCHVPVSIWYDWKNDGVENPFNGEFHFGTVRNNLKIKQAYSDAEQFTENLWGYSVIKRIITKDPDDFLLLCENAKGRQKLVAWTITAPHMITYKSINIFLSAHPVYIKQNILNVITNSKHNETNIGGINISEIGEFLSEELNLTDAQKSQVISVLTSERTKINELFQNKNLSEKQKTDKKKTIHNIRSEINKILDPQQQEKFEELIKGYGLK